MAKEVDEKINGHHFKGELLSPHNAVMCINCGTDVPDGECDAQKD